MKAIQSLTRVLVAFVALALPAATASAGQAAMAGAAPLLPKPISAEWRPGAFTLVDGATIEVMAPSRQRRELLAVARYLADRIHEQTGLRLKVRRARRRAVARGAIRLTTATPPKGLGTDGHTLRVSEKEIVIAAASPRGVFLGAQTLRQLLPMTPSTRSAPAMMVPAVAITDEPRFAWRGLLLDSSRHFLGTDLIKRYIDLLAFHKMNVLHWHLTDDQGWRIEIRKYPALTAIGAWRGTGEERYGGFYTQDEIREIVAYAASRYVTIVPEIEMPGHALAALAAFPELSCTGGPFTVSTQWGVHEDVFCPGNDRTFRFLEDVLTEVLELFPSRYIHIGGDEVPTTRWETCPRCRARVADEHLDGPASLHGYFVRRIARFLAKHGRRAIGWDEILGGELPPGTVVQSWRGMDGAVAAARAGHDVIVSPTSHCYLDYPQAPGSDAPSWMPVTSLETAYKFEPVPEGLSDDQKRHVLGAQGNLWTEHAPEPRIDRQAFPRLVALAEVMWTRADRRDYADFTARLQQHYSRLDALGVMYFVPPPEPAPGPQEGPLVLAFAPPFQGGEIRYTIDGTEPTSRSLLYDRPVQLTEPAVIKARTFLKTGNASDVAEFRLPFLESRERPQPPTAR